MFSFQRSSAGNDNDVCRLCSSNSGIMVLNIFDSEGRRRRVLSLIKDCLPVQISENDPLPKVICHNCLHKLEIFHEFQRSCLKSEEVLRNGASYSTYPTLRSTPQEFDKPVYTPQDYIEKQPPLPAFRGPSQEFTDKPGPKNVPDFTAELHPVHTDHQLMQQTTATKEQPSEQSNDRKESFEQTKTPLEIVMVKQEIQEVKDPEPEEDEDTGWEESNVEDDSLMQTDQGSSEMLQSEDDVKSEMGAAGGSPIIRCRRINSSMERTRKYREKLKNNKERLETYLLKERARAKKAREKIKKYLEGNKEALKLRRLRDRERQRKYRERMKQKSNK